ncbi:hypothetical protein B0H19DRAFT_1143579 [Mycena capillaripes]|nr:hypothetical protein B0H19DRAFT_1143579 [Mycena capillaripes]
MINLGARTSFKTSAGSLYAESMVINRCSESRYSSLAHSRSASPHGDSSALGLASSPGTGIALSDSSAPSVSEVVVMDEPISQTSSTHSTRLGDPSDIQTIVFSWDDV